MTVGAVGQQLRLRLFLEGIEVPVIGAQIQSNLNAPATASIQVIPVDSVVELKARTMVHLFYWDFNQDLPQPPTSDVVEDTTDPDRTLTGYKLAFGGEVVGLTMAKSPIGRQAVLQCADWSTYWDTSYQTFISYSPNGNFLGDNSAMWSGGNTMFHNILSSHSGVMNSYLRRRPKTPGLQDVRGLMGGIISLLEAMGGVPRHVSGINDYFTIAELKNHLLQQITAEQNDNTAQKLFSGKSFSEWLNRGVTSLGELVSFRDMLKLLFHWVYYEVVPITSPRYIPAVLGTTTERVVSRKSTTKGLKQTDRDTITKMLRITNRYSGSGASLSNTVRRQFRTNEKRVATVLIQNIDTVLVSSSTTLPDETKKSLENAKNILTQIQTVPGRSTLDENEVVTSQVNAPTTRNVRGLGTFGRALSSLSINRARWSRAEEALQEALRTRASRRVTKRKTVQDSTRPQVDRLQAQIFRPDCFFVAPPKCNVIFPDQYVQWQFNRNFLQEVTRLRLTTGLQFISGKGAGFLTNAHLAPSTRDIRRLARTQGNRGLRTLLPWEKFTGILPKFEHISEINYLANRRQRKLQKNVRGQGRSYAQRAANFNFFKYRFAPRSMSVAMKFAPQFALGFPGLLIDKPFIVEPESVRRAVNEAQVEGIEEVELNDLVANIGPLAAFFRSPTQYLGMPAAVSHNIDQNGGTTSITFTHARSHKITDDDFMGTFLEEVQRGTVTREESTVLDAEQLLRDGDYRKLQFLIDSTPQDLIVQTTESFGIVDDEGRFIDDLDDTDDPEDEVGADLRPNGAPNLTTLSQLAPVIFTTPDPGLFEGSRIQVQSVAFGTDLDSVTGESVSEDSSEFSGTGFVRWRGPVRRNTRKGTRTTILEPSPYAKIKPGSRGLLRKGRVTQIQLFSDSVIKVSTADVDSFVKSRRDRNRIRRQRRRGQRPDTVFLWRKAVIYEEVTRNSTRRPVPLEEAIRPPWFSPLYSNLFIGPEIYQKFFGTGSIVDQSVFLTPQGAAVFGNTALTDAERDEFIGKIREADGDAVKIAQLMEDSRGETLGKIPDIETSVNALAFLYGEVRRQGLDVQQFVASYTSRPIATLKDMLGSLDLEYEIQGDQLVQTSGEAGFHSTAVAPFGDLLGLVDNPDLELPRIHRRGPKFPISRALDPRPERRARVEDYRDEMGGSRGSLGTGLLG